MFCWHIGKWTPWMYYELKDSDRVIGRQKRICEKCGFIQDLVVGNFPSSTKNAMTGVLNNGESTVRLRHKEIKLPVTEEYGLWNGHEVN